MNMFGFCLISNVVSGIFKLNTLSDKISSGFEAINDQCIYATTFNDEVIKGPINHHR